jgi:hypothetical protein
VIFPDQSPTSAEIVPVPEPELAPPSAEFGPPATVPPVPPGPLPGGPFPPPVPPGAAPVPPDLPLAPPAPMGGRAAPHEPNRESSRRNHNAWYPPPNFHQQDFAPPINSGFPVAPAAYHPASEYPLR